MNDGPPWGGLAIVGVCGLIVWWGHHRDLPEEETGWEAAFNFLFIAAVIVGGLGLLVLVLNGLSGPSYSSPGDCYNPKCY